MPKLLPLHGPPDHDYPQASCPPLLPQAPAPKVLKLPQPHSQTVMSTGLMPTATPPLKGQVLVNLLPEGPPLLSPKGTHSRCPRPPAPCTFPPIRPDHMVESGVSSAMLPLQRLERQANRGWDRADPSRKGRPAPKRPGWANSHSPSFHRQQIHQLRAARVCSW